MRIIAAFMNFMLLFITSGFCQNDSLKEPQKAVTIILRPVGGQVSYELEGKNVPAQELLNRLGGQFSKGGKKLNILAHQDIKMIDIFGTLAIAGKVGFADTRIYCYDKQKRGMSEVTIGPERPYRVAP